MNVKTKNVSADVKFENVQRYLIAKKKGELLEFYQTIVIPQDPTDTRHSFSGDMLVYKLTENKKAIFSYKRGELENGQYYARQTEQSNSQFATIGCLYYHQCTWTSTCDGTFTVVYSRGQGHPTQTLDCGIPQLYQCPGAVWNNTGNGWEVFCNNDPIDPLPPVYPPPTGSGGSGDGGPVVDPIHPSYDDFRYICPTIFRFVAVTTNELWQAANIQNAHCNIKFYDGDSRQYVSRTVEVPNMYFQAPYRDTSGVLLLTPYLASLYATQAFNDGENAMHDAFKSDIYLTSSQLSALWLKTANSIYMGLTKGAGRVTATPPFNTSTPIPIVQYVACP